MSEDSGFYSCLAWNQAGTDQYTTRVQVVNFIGEESRWLVLEVLTQHNMHVWLPDAGNDTNMTAPLDVERDIMLVRPESQTIETGSPLVVDCIPNVYPPPALRWLRDGEQLPLCLAPNPQRVCIQCGESEFSEYIYIPSAVESDSGVYACQFELDGQVKLYSAVITVLPAQSEFSIQTAAKKFPSF